MDQSNILHEVIDQFAQKFTKLAKVKIRDPVAIQDKEDQPLIMLTVLGMEEIVLRNMNEKIQRKGKDDQGNNIEYFIAPATLFNVSVMVTPYFKTYTDTLKIIGAIARLMKDNNQMPVGEYDWLDNNNKPIFINPVAAMNLEKQMQIFNMLRSDYRPSLFYQFIIGIDSDKKDIFKRVKERKFEAEVKKEQK